MFLTQNIGMTYSQYLINGYNLQTIFLRRQLTRKLVIIIIDRYCITLVIDRSFILKQSLDDNK